MGICGGLVGPKRGKVKKVLVFKAKSFFRPGEEGREPEEGYVPRGGFRRGKEDYNKKKTKEMKKIILQ